MLSALLVILPLNSNANLLDIITNKCYNDCSISETGVSLIKFVEGYSPFVYKDSAGKATIGHGHLILKGEKFKQPLSPKEAHNLLLQDIKAKEQAVNRLVEVPLKQNQFDALVSFTFNLGEGTLARSTLLKLVNSERHVDASRWLLEYCKITLPNGTKKVIRGLVLRREAEKKLYDA